MRAHEVTGYRISYDVVKPGGTVVHECEAVRGGEDDLFAWCGLRNPDGSYCHVIEYRGSDSDGEDVTDEYGWRATA